MLKSESKMQYKIVYIVYMQYKISDNHALFWRFVLIILRMASLDTALMFCGTESLALFLTCSYFFPKIKAFVLIKLFL